MSQIRTIGAGAFLAASGYLHAQLYLDGYRFLHVIGILFLLQAAASFALAALLLTGAVLRPPVLVQLGAAATALGALGGFTISRTIGLFGFTDRGLDPAPQALLSLLAESAVLVLLAPDLLRTVRIGRRSRP
jgi:hypothetical protein